MIRTVFVYGTLKRGYGNHRLLEKASFVGNATIKGFVMFDMGAFPGIMSGKGIIHGELYNINDSILESLDRLEGYNSMYPERGLYNKTTTKAILDTRKVDSLVYVVNNPYSTTVIPEGIWL